MRQRNSSYPINFVVTFTPVVKYLMIVNVVLWLVGTIILQGYVFDQNYVFQWLGLVPSGTVFQFKLWQPLTYMFFHSSHLNHLLFNMLLLWWVGCQLENTLGSKRFLKYYLVCGVGAALLYLAVLFGIYGFIGLADTSILHNPVIGASGAVFGLLLAYGMYHGDNVVYFLMLFPMKARYFVGILALMETFVLLNAGFSGPVANLAHVGGILVGFVYLMSEKWWMKKQTDKLLKKATAPGQRRLKLVVDNEKKTQTFH